MRLVVPVALEHEPSAKLHLPGGGDCRTDAAERGLRLLVVAIPGERDERRTPEVGAIEQVEHFDPNLETRVPLEDDRFHGDGIDRAQVRTAERAAAAVAGRPGGCNRNALGSNH